MRKVLVKFCGLRNETDVEYINSAKPDFAGFVLSKSKRKISLTELESLLKKLDNEIKSVGVFVDENIDFVIQAVQVGLDVVQLHGHEDKTYVSELKKCLNEKGLKSKIWKAIRLSDDNFEIDRLTNSSIKSSTKNSTKSSINTTGYDFPDNVDGFLIDKYSEKEAGGTGEKINLEVANNAIKSIRKNFPNRLIILAGGLNSKNVRSRAGIEELDGVDVSSGIEIDGKKDFEQMIAFLDEIE